MLKKDKLRYNEYYDMQKVYDELYARSENSNNFYKLLEIIGSEQNIRLAYRNLKTNSGSKTAGTDGKTIDDMSSLIATNVYNNLTDVSYALLPAIRIRLRSIGKTTQFRNTDYEFQSKTKGIRDDTKIVIIGKMPLLPITGVHHKSPMNFSQDITNFTAKGREKIHKTVRCVSNEDIVFLSKIRDPNETIEFNDNRISAFLVQQGSCYVLGQRLNTETMRCFRKKSLENEGTDNYRNIVFVEQAIGTAVITEDANVALKLILKFKLDSKQLGKLNRLRMNNGYQPLKLK